jgi:cytochrome c-type biogenesis protein CcmF
VILIGELSLWVALLMAAWATTVSFAGGALKRDDLIVSGRRGLYATSVMVALASIGLWTALLTRDFSLEYVAAHISAAVPSLYVFTAFCSGQAGSMLFCALILSVYSAVAIATSRERNPMLTPWAAGTLGAVLLFFIATICLRANPFTRLDWSPPDGRGMNPQVQNLGMAFHPPNLYLGYVATAIPFAFAVAALISRRLDVEWLAVVRRWSLLSWFLLTLGIVTGMRSAYVEFGRSEYWAWDPVENASLLPWLTATAFLHSMMIQEKRGMLRKWNVVLVAVTFLLSILGTSLTWSGVVERVPSLAQSPVGSWFATFVMIATAATIYLVATRLRDLEAKAKLESMVSREAAFLYNNLVLCGIAVAVMWGTLFPILSEALTGKKVTVGPLFFNTVNVPLGLLLLALTGIGPLISWRKGSLFNLKRLLAAPGIAGAIVLVVLAMAGVRKSYALIAYGLCGFVAVTIVQEFYKDIGARRSMHGESIVAAFRRVVGGNRRRYGGYVVHAGIVMLFAAFAGLAFKGDHDLTLRSGEAAELRDPYGHLWRFVSQGPSTSELPDQFVLGVTLETWRDGKRLGFITSEKRQYLDSQKQPVFEPVTKVGIRSSAKLDTYVVLADVRDDVTDLRVSFNPLVVWVWIGGSVMMIGGLIVMWPQAQRRPAQGGFTAVRPPKAATTSEAPIPV